MFVSEGSRSCEVFDNTIDLGIVGCEFDTINTMSDSVIDFNMSESTDTNVTHNVALSEISFNGTIIIVWMPANIGVLYITQ